MFAAILLPQLAPVFECSPEKQQNVLLKTSLGCMNIVAAIGNLQSMIQIVTFCHCGILLPLHIIIKSSYARHSLSH
jgi:hypothetical protein